MALSQGSSAIWSDINSLYTTLRSIQSTHGLTQTAVPSDGGQGKTILTTHITPINTALEAMKNETHLRRSSYVGQGTNPTRGALITPAIISELKTKLDNLANVRHSDSFSTGNTGSSFCNPFAGWGSPYTTGQSTYNCGGLRGTWGP